MRAKGQITVFLSMTILLIISLMLGLLESARMAGAVWYLKTAADSATVSVFSQYHRKLWEDYRLLYLETEGGEQVAEQWERYINPYLDSYGWYPMEIRSVEIESMESAVDTGGDNFQQEILDYMRYGIFDLDLDPDRGTELIKNIKEGNSVSTISRSYEANTKDAVKLEQALEDIYTCLNNQKDAYNAGVQRLKNWDGSGFRKEAKRMKREMGRIPGLVENYDTQADALSEKIGQTEAAAAAEWANLGNQMADAMSETASVYQDYTSETGTRRLEIDRLPSQMTDMEETVDSAVQRSDEVDEEIDNWDEEDEDGPDEDELWDSVLTIWKRIKLPGVISQTGVKDKKKQGFLEQVGKMADMGLLQLLMPEDAQLSPKSAEITDLPSNSFAKESGGTDYQIVDRLLTDEYCVKFFVNVLSEVEPERNRQLLYEQEYILGGKSSDRENLGHTATMLVAVREGLNLAHILSDSQKRQEARGLAAVIAGVAGITPLVEILSFFIMTVWALGEALMDVKALLAGEKVPLFKTRENWRLTLTALLEMGEHNSIGDGENGKEGLDYTEYVKLMLLIEGPQTLYYRMMDVIQMNLALIQQDFTMKDCMYQVDIKAELIGKHLFYSGSDNTYPLRVCSQKAY